LFIGCCMVLTTACQTAGPRLLGDGKKIDDVEFRGVKAFSKGALLGYLHIGESGWMPMSPDYPNDEALLDVDLRRIEEAYAAKGYLWARVSDVQVRPEKNGKEVDIVITVDEGPQAAVSTVDFHWHSDQLLADDERASVQKSCEMAVDGPCDTALFNASLGALRQTLMQRGFPLAQVSGKVLITKEQRSCAVSFDLRPGSLARIGSVSFEGLVEVPEEPLQVEVEFALGKQYCPALVQQMEQAVKSTRVFRWVATRMPDQVNEGLINPTIRLSEADPQSIALGAQLSMETVRWQEQVSLDYVHTNLFGNLTRLDLHTVAGWAEMPNPWSPDLHGPVVAVEPLLSRKGLLEKHLLWTLGPAFQMNLQEGYQYYQGSNRIGVSRWFQGRYNIGLSHNIAYVDFFNTSPELDSSSSILGLDFRDPYWLSYVELRAEAYFVNNISKPTDGIILEAIYDLAGGVLGGDYDHHKVTAGMRAFWKPAARLQVAARLQSGLILTYGDSPGAPINSRFYLGGANSVRGWGSRHLSPRLEKCDDLTGDCSSIPVGGYTMVQGNFEVRLELFGPLSLVGFFDMGDVQSGELSFDTSQWNYAAGPGLRADTPIGLARLDAGFRLNDPGVFPDEPVWAIYFGLGETF